MAKILVTGTYPPVKFEEGMKVYGATNKPKYPDFVKKTDSWATLPDDGQYKALAIYECPNEKLYDAIKAITKRYNFYATSLAGYTFKVELLIPEAEALQAMTQK